MGAYDVVTHSTESDWLAARTTGIGASEMPAVLGVSPWNSALELYAEKIGAAPREDLSESEIVQWGHRLEPVIVTAYVERSGRWAERDGHLLRSTEHPWALCTLDARTCEPPRDQAAPWPLEVKTTSAYRADDWVDGPPDVYLVQIQHQMLVTGAELATIACLIGGQRLVWCDVPRDEQLIRKIVYHGALFWERVQRREAPDPTGPGAAKVLRSLYPIDDGRCVELATDLLDTVDELEALKAEQKRLDSAREALEAKLMGAMGEAERGVFAAVPGLAITWKTQERAAYTVPAGTRRPLLISKQRHLKKQLKAG